jgi:hypothetical protein
LSAPANSHQTLFLRVNDPKIHLRTAGAKLSLESSQLEIQFPAGTGSGESGYVETMVTLSW